MGKRGRYNVIRDNLHAKEVVIGDGERRQRYILCYNPKEAKRQKGHREEVVRYLRVTKSNKIRIDRGAIREAAKYDGKWVLETNDDTLSLQDAAEGYKGLMVIERCFRSLKGIPPNILCRRASLARLSFSTGGCGRKNPFDQIS